MPAKRVVRGRATGAACAAAAAVVGGCGQLNNEIVLGYREPEWHQGAVTLSTLNPDVPLFDPTQPGTVSEARPLAESVPPPPSVLNVTRENWRSVDFLVPVDGVEHWAMSRSDPDWTDDNGGQRNEEYPTEFSVIHGEPTLDSNLAQAAEGVLAPFYAGIDGLMLLPRLFVDPPWEVMSSPRNAYQRAPRPLPRIMLVPPDAVPVEMPPDPLPEQPADPAAIERSIPEAPPRTPDYELPPPPEGRAPTGGEQ